MRASRPIHAVHVIDNLSPGGTERQCVGLVRGLAGLGIRNTVFYGSPGPLLADLGSAGVPACAMPSVRVRSVRFPVGVIALARRIRRQAPDVVQTYGFYSNLLGLTAALIARVPVRVAGRREFGWCLTAAQRRADRWAWRLAHRIVANSDAVRHQLIDEERVPPGKVVVIRNGLDLTEWLEAPASAEDDSDLVVGMVAHFRQEKDHPTFLEAAAEVLKFVPSARFCLVGSGVLEPAVRERARRLGLGERVEFGGRLDGAALRAAVRQFTVSVLASKSEGLPNSVLESMAAGRPVVATAVGGTRELVEDGVTGFLIPPGDPVALADRIVRLLKDPSLARGMGERGRRKVEREFTLGRMAGQFGDLYRDLLAGRPRRHH